jgi:DNA helicase HerA-like ATPase
MAMTTNHVMERRRTTRVTPAVSSQASIAVSLPVRVLDVSRSGVLLESKGELRVGDRAELNAALGDRSLSLVIEVRHVSLESTPRAGMRYRAGAVFVEPSSEQRQMIDRLLGAEQK